MQPPRSLILISLLCFFHKLTAGVPPPTSNIPNPSNGSFVSHTNSIKYRVHHSSITLDFVSFHRRLDQGRLVIFLQIISERLSQKTSEGKAEEIVPGKGFQAKRDGFYLSVLHDLDEGQMTWWDVGTVVGGLHSFMIEAPASQGFLETTFNVIDDDEGQLAVGALLISLNDAEPSETANPSLETW